MQWRCPQEDGHDPGVWAIVYGFLAPVHPGSPSQTPELIIKAKHSGVGRECLNPRVKSRSQQCVCKILLALIDVPELIFKSVWQLMQKDIILVMDASLHTSELDFFSIQQLKISLRLP